MKDFLNKLITAGSGVSSKRLVGVICYILITVSILVLLFVKPEFSGLSDIVNTLIITTASLLGMTTIEKFSSSLLGKKNDDNKKDNDV